MLILIFNFWTSLSSTFLFFSHFQALDFKSQQHGSVYNNKRKYLVPLGGTLAPALRYSPHTINQASTLKMSQGQILSFSRIICLEHRTILDSVVDLSFPLVLRFAFSSSLKNSVYATNLENVTMPGNVQEAPMESKEEWA